MNSPQEYIREMYSELFAKGSDAVKMSSEAMDKFINWYLTILTAAFSFIVYEKKTLLENGNYSNNDLKLALILILGSIVISIVCRLTNHVYHNRALVSFEGLVIALKNRKFITFGRDVNEYANIIDLLGALKAHHNVDIAPYIDLLKSGTYDENLLFENVKEFYKNHQAWAKKDLEIGNEYIKKLMMPVFGAKMAAKMAPMATPMKKWPSLPCLGRIVQVVFYASFLPMLGALAIFICKF